MLFASRPLSGLSSNIELPSSDIVDRERHLSGFVWVKTGKTPWLRSKAARSPPAGRDQSRLLKIYDRVCWKNSASDLGTVIGTAWSDITISWDDGDTTSVQHNNMEQVEQVPTKAKCMEWVGTKTMANTNFSEREQF